MFWKLLAVIVTFAVCAASLLAARHQRTQALSEITQAQLRINRQDERLWGLRSRIGERITPPRVERLTAGLIDLHPISTSNSLTQAELARLVDPNVIGPPSPIARTHVVLEEAERLAAAARGESSLPRPAATIGTASGKPKSPSKAGIGAKTQPRPAVTPAKSPPPGRKPTPKNQKKSPTRVAQNADPEPAINPLEVDQPQGDRP